MSGPCRHWKSSSWTALVFAAKSSKLANSLLSMSTSTGFTSSPFSSSSSASVLFSRKSSRGHPRFSSVLPRAESGRSPLLGGLAASSPKRHPRFFVEPEQLLSSPSPSAAPAEKPTAAAISTAGSIIVLPPTEARHARKVLRLQAGASVELCDGRGSVARGTLMEQTSKGDPLAVELSGPPTLVPAPSPRLSLVVAALGLKGGRGDWLVEKAAELGAAALVPLSTERSPDNSSAAKERDGGGEQREFEHRRRLQRQLTPSPSASSSPATSSSRVARWHRLAEAAGKQCLRAHALDVAPATVSVEELARRLRREKPLLALVAAEGAPPVADVVLRAFPRRGQRGDEEGKEPELEGGARDENKDSNDVVYLIVGPEGDFTPTELEALVSAGAKPCGLGTNRLRVETASEALLAVASALLL